MKAATALLLPFAYAAPAFPPPAELIQGVVNSNISLIAGGTLPNNTAAVATGIAVTGLQLLASLENIEAFFYSDAIQNLTSGVYTTGDLLLNDTIEIIEKIAAQEEVHVATVGAVLRLNSAPVVPPCKYTFPATNFDEFLGVANLITSTNFGSVIGLQQQLGGSAPALSPATTAILGVETRHDAFLRILHGVVPNPAPFDTAIPIAWAYNIGLQYTVPGSCPVEVPLPTYPQLSFDPAEPPSFASASYPSTISFAWDDQQAWVQRETGKQLYAAWINQYNLPVYTPVTVTGAGSGITPVPKDMQAVAFVALTTLQPLDFTDLQDATLVGPLAIAVS
ncbi:hypothetical protein HO173_010265 [Letharia columbiana]|uniref:Sexual development protein n=1 Tax=Letharia columbiana TaxID=112416 RepID=A0A8H6L121_9LECA|nr:uncharacterized protein HO173_010265 [Letharia columbiana]KAF6231513.1 hypothetical protein HO173_010265 [Letharia columbiana]